MRDAEALESPLVTIAICIKCGATKHGALTPCRACRFMPEENADKARSMIVTDHFLSPDDLAGIGERIRTGQPVEYPEEAVAEYIKLFESRADRLPKVSGVGCVATIIFVVIGILVWLYV